MIEGVAGRVPVFRTERLEAREMSLADLDFIASLLADPEVIMILCNGAAPSAG